VPTALVYFVAAGVKNDADEEAFRHSMGIHFDEIGDACLEADIETFVTSKGVVGVRFTADSRQLVGEAVRLSKLYFAGLGVASCDELPSRSIRTSNSSEFAPLPPPYRPPQMPDDKPKSRSSKLVVEDLLATISKQRVARSSDLVESLGLPFEIVEKYLANLIETGLIAASAESSFALTEAGVAEAAQVVGGRKAVMDALVEHGSLSIFDLTQLTGVTETVPKRAVRRLIGEGMVERAPETQRSKRRPRQLYRLTAKGQLVGSNYDPRTTRPKGWKKLTPGRWKIIEILLAADGRFTRSKIVALTGLSEYAVKTFLNESAGEGYVDKTIVDAAPITYGFAITPAGRAAAHEYARVNGKPGEQPAEDAEEKSEAPQAAMYQVRVASATPEVLEMLRQLGEFDGVEVVLAEESS
jgi:predicted ArsR family transcriptional regulator